MYRQCRWRPFCAFWTFQLSADCFWWQLARHQGHTMRTSTGCSTCVSYHKGVPTGGERVLQLARHHGCPTDCVRWVTHTKFFVSQKESTITDSLEEETKRDFINLVGNEYMAESATWCNSKITLYGCNHNTSVLGKSGQDSPEHHIPYLSLFWQITKKTLLLLCVHVNV